MHPGARSRSDPSFYLGPPLPSEPPLWSRSAPCAGKYPRPAPAGDQPLPLQPNTPPSCQSARASSQLNGASYSRRPRKQSAIKTRPPGRNSEARCANHSLRARWQELSTATAVSKQLSPGTASASHSSARTRDATPACAANRATQSTWEGTQVTAVTRASNSCAQKIAPPPRPQPTSRTSPHRLDDAFQTLAA